MPTSSDPDLHLHLPKPDTTNHCQDTNNATSSSPQMVMSVILAAGKGRRMGMPKALLTWRGQTFIDHLISAQTSAGITQFVVVTIAQDGPFDAVSPGPRPDANPASAGSPSLAPEVSSITPLGSSAAIKIHAITAQPTAPQLHSLHAALAQIKALRSQAKSPTQSLASHEWPALLVGPVDQGPYPAALVEALLEGFDPRASTVRIPTYKGTPGHPALIGGGFVPHILNDHEGGLRGIFQAHAASISYIPLPYPEIPRNLNTRTQYDAFLAAHP